MIHYNYKTLVRGYKHYELSTHLGNVLAVISDKRITLCASSVVSGYEADVISASDYYPFGMLMSDRSFSSPAYRYGFNGKEKIDEINGEGNELNFDARIYDSRTCNTLSIDPHFSKYPWQSPYCFLTGNPIFVIDKTGKDNVIYLLALPSANSSLTKVQIDDIRKQANSNFENLGLKTRVVIVDPNKFDIFKIDKTDGVSVLGDKKSVIQYVKSNLDKSFGEELENEWVGGGNSPEKSKNNGKGASTDNIIAIDASGLKGAANNFNINDETNPVIKTAALCINHGGGHNSGQQHTSTSLIMYDARDLSVMLGNNESYYPKYDDIVNNKPKVNEKDPKNRNQSYVDAMKRRFGNNDAIDNYSKRIKSK